ncbi:MAG TPA: hypothetical protein VMO76_05125 [Candidatus Udaeobacter sp.]|jgi:hypothetical protein|nr:hypothetical protein [Candidatus Udaeobacter sp.]
MLYLVIERFKNRDAKAVPRLPQPGTHRKLNGIQPDAKRIHP